MLNINLKKLGKTFIAIALTQASLAKYAGAEDSYLSPAARDIIDFHSMTCGEQTKIINHSIYEIDDESKALREYLLNSDSLLVNRVELKGTNDFAEVIFVDRPCDPKFNDEHCGTGGCAGYLIFPNGLITEFLAHSITAIPGAAALDMPNSSILVFDQGAMTCRYVGAQSKSDNRPCVTFAIWNGEAIELGDALVRAIDVPK